MPTCASWRRWWWLRAKTSLIDHWLAYRSAFVAHCKIWPGGLSPSKLPVLFTDASLLQEASCIRRAPLGSVWSYRSPALPNLVTHSRILQYRLKVTHGCAIRVESYAVTQTPILTLSLQLHHTSWLSTTQNITILRMLNVSTGSRHVIPRISYYFCKFTSTYPDAFSQFIGWRVKTRVITH